MKLFFAIVLFSISSFSEASSASSERRDPYEYFDHDGIKIAYRVFGVGAPLFLLNGGPGRSSDSFTHLAEKLSSDHHHQVIIFDQRGAGRPKLPVLNERTVSLDLMISDLEALRVHLHFDKVSILGHSFGGMYAMAYASRFPQNVQSLILSCSGGVDLSWQHYAQHNMLSRLSQKARDEYAFWTSPEQEQIDPVRSAREALRLLIPAYIYHQQFVPQLEKDLLNPNYSTPGLNPLVWKSMKDFNLRGAFEKFTVPTLIIDGRQDILGEAVPMAIHQEIPNSVLHFIDKCSHYPWMDGPDEYFALIASFLSR